EVTVPLFRGGGLNSQRKQAALLADAAGQRYQQTIRDISQQARQEEVAPDDHAALMRWVPDDLRPEWARVEG
ncbi:TolC family protein, partial [Aeromicrobium sp.]|uniref:TolC family protein n=1 Tax=Aeromicrobium sp. TaxID=1871063 RepID=UPI00351453A6